MVSIDPQRVIKQTCIDEWQAQLQAHESERWHPDHSSKSDVKDTKLFQIARQMAYRYSLGQAIESGQYDLQTIGQRWWEKDNPHKDWLTQLHSENIDSLSTCYGSDWWEVFEEGIWPFKKRGVQWWQLLEFERQMTMLRYSRNHIFGNDYEGVYSAKDVDDAFNKSLDSFAFSMTDTRGQWHDWVFARPWDYRHFAQCLKANLEGKPYLYKHL